MFYRALNTLNLHHIYKQSSYFVGLQQIFTFLKSTIGKHKEKVETYSKLTMKAPERGDGKTQPPPHFSQITQKG